MDNRCDLQRERGRLRLFGWHILTHVSECPYFHFGPHSPVWLTAANSASEVYAGPN